MELSSSIEPTIGPYEVWRRVVLTKAAFEAFITVKDRAESAQLQRFADALQEIENRLPIDPAYRNPKLGAMAPIAVVNTVFSAGTPIAGSRRPPSTCPTTSASFARRAASG